MKYLANLDHANDLYTHSGRQHSRQGRLHIVYGVINDVVITDLDTVLLCLASSGLLSADIKAKDYRIGSDGQVDITFRDTTDSGMYDFNLDLVSSQLL